MTTTLFVTGASSGIGEAFLALTPEDIARRVTFSRRPSHGDWHEADLADPASWALISAEVERVLDADEPDHAIFFHCSGVMDPLARVVDADPAEYARALIVNAAAGPSIGQAFLRACHARDIRATLVITSTPAAHKVQPMIAQYSGSKRGMEQWAACAASEVEPESQTRVFTVVPYAVLTDMVRSAMKEDPEDLPLVNYFRQVEAADEFASAELTGEQVWAAIATADNGDVVPVGAVWIAERNAAAAAAAAAQGS